MAVVLPMILLFLYGYGVSFDVTTVRIGLVIEDPTPATNEFRQSLSNTPYFNVRVSPARQAFLADLTAGRLDGIVVISGDFSQRLGRADTAPVQIITDGSDPNTASLVTGYVQGAWQSWLNQRLLSAGAPPGGLDRARAARLVQSRA